MPAQVPTASATAAVPDGGAEDSSQRLVTAAQDASRAEGSGGGALSAVELRVRCWDDMTISYERNADAWDALEAALPPLLAELQRGGVAVALRRRSDDDAAAGAAEATAGLPVYGILGSADR